MLQEVLDEVNEEDQQAEEQEEKQESLAQISSKKVKPWDTDKTLFQSKSTLSDPQAVCLATFQDTQPQNITQPLSLQENVAKILQQIESLRVMGQQQSDEIASIKLSITNHRSSQSESDSNIDSSLYNLEKDQQNPSLVGVMETPGNPVDENDLINVRPSLNKPQTS